MGKVKYGAVEHNGKWHPEITITLDGGEVLPFVCGRGFSEVEKAREFSELVYLVLSGRQHGPMIHEPGTPKDLRQAIMNGMTIGKTMMEVRDNIFDHVKDFLAQRFQTAYLKAEELPQGKAFEEVLENLYGALTK